MGHQIPILRERPVLGAKRTLIALIRLAGGREGSHDLVDAGFKLGDRE
jgi:hypothetical protein